MISKAKLEIRRSEATDAEDSALVDRVVAIVNAAYFWSEAEQRNNEKERTSTPEITDLLKKRKLLLAFASEQLAGVVKIEKIGPKIAGFGILATDPNGLQRGVSKALVGAAEAWALAEGFGETEIEIVCAENPNSHKQLLHDWYTRLNYIEIATFPVIERIPEITPLQKQNSVSTVYRKLLS